MNVYVNRWILVRIYQCIQSFWNPKLWYLFTDTAVIIYRTTSSAQVKSCSAVLWWRHNKEAGFLVNGNVYFHCLAGNVMTLKFLSDASVTAGGFQLKYSTTDASEVPQNHTRYFNWAHSSTLKHSSCVLHICLHF